MLVEALLSTVVKNTVAEYLNVLRSAGKKATVHQRILVDIHTVSRLQIDPARIVYARTEIMCHAFGIGASNGSGIKDIQKSLVTVKLKNAISVFLQLHTDDPVFFDRLDPLAVRLQNDPFVRSLGFYLKRDLLISHKIHVRAYHGLVKRTLVPLPPDIKGVLRYAAGVHGNFFTVRKYPIVLRKRLFNFEYVNIVIVLEF
jgi:hypothetical protein